MKWVWLQKCNMNDLQGDGNVVLTVFVNILVVILYYSSAKCYC